VVLISEASPSQLHVGFNILRFLGGGSPEVLQQIFTNSDFDDDFMNENGLSITEIQSCVFSSPRGGWFEFLRFLATCSSLSVAPSDESRWTALGLTFKRV
jgi:hypothetical protein